MKKQPQLIDVTELARNAGFGFTWGDSAIASWLEQKAGSDTTLIPVYMTRLLWTTLGGDSLKPERFRERAEHVLRVAHQKAIERMIEQRSWRAGLVVESNGASLTLWLILGHGYANGFALGHGPGDFW